MDLSRWFWLTIRFFLNSIYSVFCFWFHGYKLSLCDVGWENSCYCKEVVDLFVWIEDWGGTDLWYFLVCCLSSKWFLSQYTSSLQDCVPIENKG
jgi:hypothetical protein